MRGRWHTPEGEWPADAAFERGSETEASGPVRRLGVRRCLSGRTVKRCNVWSEDGSATEASECEEVVVRRPNVVLPLLRGCAECSTAAAPEARGPLRTTAAKVEGRQWS